MTIVLALARNPTVFPLLGLGDPQRSGGAHGTIPDFGEHESRRTSAGKARVGS
jgi:hypothetical protein